MRHTFLSSSLRPFTMLAMFIMDIMFANTICRFCKSGFAGRAFNVQVIEGGHVTLT